VSSNFPELPPEPSSWNAEAANTDLRISAPNSYKREWIWSVILLLATMASTSFAGLCQQLHFDIFLALRALIVKPSLILDGLPFSVPLISILLAHEFGHFWACKYYGMRCTPPFFLPIPISFAGTLGAFIKIKSPFLHKRALFDIGIAGPLAGFLFILPTLWIGISRSILVPKGTYPPGVWIFGEPLIFRLFGLIVLGYSPEQQDMGAHPMAMAAWIGLLATSFNLLPIWQLDGGHIAYAIFGSSLQKKISVVAIAAMILAAFMQWPPSVTLLVFAIVLLVVGGIRFRFLHPPTLMDEGNLGVGRLILGLLAFLILILSFTPVPVTIS
jgi:membrane-associated protease RseP (regulator of RpoE activity)